MEIGRHLAEAGAVAFKNSVYAMPLSERAREDLEWVAHEIASDGGRLNRRLVAPGPREIRYRVIRP